MYRHDQAKVEGSDNRTSQVDRFDADEFWVRLARDAYDSSEDYFDSAVRADFEKAMAHFNSEHAPGSKYHTTQYRKKSKFFRPKTRASIRRNEMGMAVALFSTDDVVHCSAVNESDERQVMAAEVKNQILNFRLNEPEFYWFQTAIGGAQEAMNAGSVISKQHWRYETGRSPTQQVTEEEDGTATITPEGFDEILVDRPAMDLVPLENMRIDPGADWRDPMNSSPYVIELIPMYVYEVRGKAETIDPETDQPYYAPVDDLVMKASIEEEWDSIRRYREGTDRLDRFAKDRELISDFKLVWVHHNIVRVDGYDFVFDTLGPTTLLSQPRPIGEVYRHLKGKRERPYTMGFSIIEAHKLYPAGLTLLSFSSQKYTNDIANLRQDNVRLSLNKRFWVRRGSQVDVRSLIRNVAGGVTMMADPTRDVKESATPDVTRSSFEEQDRLNADFDDIAGTFSGGSVNTNRNLNETVGGMKMLSGGADQMQEFMIRTITETWLERSVRQILMLEEAYESDLELLGAVAARHQITERDVLMLLHEPTRLKLNVGFGSTNPEKRIEKMALGFGTVAKFFPELVQQADQAEMVKEVFGALGYRDGKRFFPHLYQEDIDPQLAAAMQENEQLKGMLQGKQMEFQSKERIAQIAAESRLMAEKIKQETAMMREQAQGNIEQFRQSLKARIDDIDARLKAAGEERERLSLALEREALSHSMLMAERDFQLRLRGEDRSDAELMGTEAKNLKGDDDAGIVSRGDYGMVKDSSL